MATHSPKDLCERKPGISVERIGCDESHQVLDDIARLPVIVPKRRPVIGVVERERGERLQCEELSIDLGSADLNSVNRDQLAMCLDERRIEAFGGEKCGLCEPESAPPSFDLT